MFRCFPASRNLVDEKWEASLAWKETHKLKTWWNRSNERNRSKRKIEIWEKIEVCLMTYIVVRRICSVQSRELLQADPARYPSFSCRGNPPSTGGVHERGRESPHKSVFFSGGLCRSDLSRSSLAAWLSVEQVFTAFDSTCSYHPLTHLPFTHHRPGRWLTMSLQEKQVPQIALCEWADQWGSGVTSHNGRCQPVLFQ